MPEPIKRAAAAAAAAGSDDDQSVDSGDGVAQIAAINRQLQRHLRLRSIQTLSIELYLLDRLSKLQIAQLIVGELRHTCLKLGRVCGNTARRWEYEVSRAPGSVAVGIWLLEIKLSSLHSPRKKTKQGSRLSAMPLPALCCMASRTEPCN
jgi:hypothetical protein